jgi:hypothetical protein
LNRSFEHSKSPHRFHVGVHPEPFERIERGLAGEAFDLDVAEPVEGEPRRPNLRFLASLQDIGVHLERILGHARSPLPHPFLDLSHRSRAGVE